MRVLLFLSLLFINSCSSYMLGQQSFISHFEQGQFKKALTDLEPCLKKADKDAILCLLETGTTFFVMRAYEKAIYYFTKAEKYTRLVDYKDLTEEAIAMLSTDTNKIFRPFDYERIMINVYLALSYLMLGRYEDAVVEAKRINNLVRVLKSKGLKKFEELDLAWFISAISYRFMNKETDANIDFSRMKRIVPFSIKDAKTLLLLSTSWIPIKTIDRNSEIPVLKMRGTCPKILVNNRRAFLLENMIKVAKRNFQERIGTLIAKNLLKTAIQGALSYGIAKATKSETLGVASFLLFRAFSTPDLRSWQSLPGCFYIADISKQKLINIKYMSFLKGKHLTIKPDTSKLYFVRLF